MFHVELLSLEIKDVRNLRSVRFTDLSGANLIYGDNGAGKTSVLEAIYFLGMARSFRSSRVNPFINHIAPLCQVFAELKDDTGSLHRVGIERMRRGGFKIKADGRQVSSASELAHLLPVQLINAHSFALLEGGSKERRKFIDWGVFHVEHAFQEAWARARRALTQRNRLLKAVSGSSRASSGSITPKTLSQIKPWDLEIARSGAQITLMRGHYFDRLKAAFQAALDKLGQGNCPEIQLIFRSGWPEDYSIDWPSQAKDRGADDIDCAPYLRALTGALERDLKGGATSVGPQRADITIQSNGARAHDILSRGQQKLVVIALKLAQCELFVQDTGRKPVLLVDDLPAEVDSIRQRILLESLKGLGVQCFFTALGGELLELGDWPIDSRRMFHVKQGVLCYP